MRYLFLFFFLFNIACGHVHNVCVFFKKHPTWYWTAQSVQHHWGVPISVQMAIMQEESRFHPHALSPRQKLLGVIPWFRKSTALGFAQALNGTWHRYIRSTHRISADRENFDDADDFIGWYVHLIHRNLRLHASDAYHVYLAYHEGMGGYRSGTYRRQPHLRWVARQVAHQAHRYHLQLINCQHRLPKKPWWRFW